jgi:hypothetical protein
MPTCPEVQEARCAADLEGLEQPLAACVGVAEQLEEDCALGVLGS